MTQNNYYVKIGNGENKAQVKQNAQGQWLWDLTIFDEGIYEQIKIADAAIYKAIMTSKKYNQPIEEKKSTKK
jgi:hypothetical protein